jgi:hypothetical protein
LVKLMWRAPRRGRHQRRAAAIDALGAVRRDAFPGPRTAAVRLPSINTLAGMGSVPEPSSTVTFVNSVRAMAAPPFFSRPGDRRQTVFICEMCHSA